MVVAGIVMFNIMELIMEIVPNYPTSRAVTLFLQHPQRKPIHGEGSHCTLQNFHQPTC
jgi:hypothetical protein